MLVSIVFTDGRAELTRDLGPDSNVDLGTFLTLSWSIESEGWVDAPSARHGRSL